VKLWFPALVLACLAVTAWHVAPAFAARETSPRLEVVGVRELRHPDFERIDAVLRARAPGWGVLLRSHVAEAIAEESERAGFDPLLVLAIISVESEFQEAAVSIVGAKGLMQVRPTTLFFVAEREGLRLSPREIESDPSLNVRLGVRYLKSMCEQFRGNLDVALMAYNAGPTRIFGAVRERNLEPFQNYVRAVRTRYSMLKLQHGEPGDWALASRERAIETAR
jgi:soluble lytic murein transglycosylase-like protein